jgi:hypothetical protein
MVMSLHDPAFAQRAPRLSPSHSDQPSYKTRTGHEPNLVLAVPGAWNSGLSSLERLRSDLGVHGQQLRRLAHRHPTGLRRGPPLHGPGVGAEPLQPLRPHHRVGGHPRAAALGLGLIPYSPLGGGLLGGALQKASQGRRADDRMQQRIQQLRPQLEAFEELCRELVKTPADVALAWLLNQPAVTATIVGPRTAD